MSSRLRTRLRRLAAACAVFTVVLTLGNMNSALANTANPITGTINSSDPDLIQCPAASGTGMTLCLFTSQDMGNVGVPYTGGSGWSTNYYPMYSEALWRLNDGADPKLTSSWSYVGPVLTEADVNSHGVTVGAYHFWAPDAKWWTPTGGTAKYYIYVPDVVDVTAESTSSRIFLWTSTEKSGANCGRFSCNYTYVGQVSSSTSQPHSGYQSDPNLFIDSGNVPYLVYANGDGSNCGSLSIGKLGSNMISWATGWPKEITISNWWDNLGECGGGHPYLEGPQLYLSSSIGAPANAPKYTMIFAAKPTDGNIPSSCNVAGTPASDKEVIAFAQAGNLNGPWNYGGIIMCGSTSEWTNQASIVKRPGSNQILFAYHDGEGSAHNRRTHLQCLSWDSLAKPFKIARSATNMINC